MEHAPTHISAVTPGELHAQQARAEAPLLLDVRDPWEWDLARLEGAMHIPLATLARSWQAMPRDRHVVVNCHHGVRSLTAAQFLAARGFAHVANLVGGMARYACDVDPRIPRY